jgi:nitroreductase
MLSAANLAPSWKNSQTPRFYVATGKKSKNAVREALPEFNRKNSENASAYIVTTVKAKFLKQIIDIKPKFF